MKENRKALFLGGFSVTQLSFFCWFSTSFNLFQGSCEGQSSLHGLNGHVRH